MLLLFACTFNSLATDNSPAAPQKILVLGDSLSAGYGIDPAQGWVALLQQRLQKRLQQNGNNYSIINASISGETSGGGLARLPALLKAHQPQWVVVELGANDGLRGYPVNILRNNLKQIIQLCQQAGAKAILIAVQIPPNYGPRYNKLFDAVFVEVANNTGTPLIPSLLGNIPLNPALMQADRLHPTAEAQPQILENIWPELSTLLEQKISSQHIE